MVQPHCSSLPFPNSYSQIQAAGTPIGSHLAQRTKETAVVCASPLRPNPIPLLPPLAALSPASQPLRNKPMEATLSRSLPFNMCLTVGVGLFPGLP